MTANIAWSYKLIKVWYLSQSYKSWNPPGLPFFEKHAAFPFSTLKLLLPKKRKKEMKKSGTALSKWDFWLEESQNCKGFKSKAGWISDQRDCYRAHQVVCVAIYQRGAGILPLNLPPLFRMATAEIRQIVWINPSTLSATCSGLAGPVSISSLNCKMPPTNSLNFL